MLNRQYSEHTVTNYITVSSIGENFSDIWQMGGKSTMSKTKTLDGLS